MEDKYKAWADMEQEEISLHNIRPVYEPGPVKLFRMVTDDQGRTIVSKDKYLFVDQFNNGLARAQDKVTGKWGFIDRHGNEVIPCVWKGLGDYSEGLMGARNDDDRCGYINASGELVIPCQWKEVWPFQEGLAIVMDFNNLLGYVNHNGEVVIPPIWKKATNFENGIAIVSNSKRFLLWDKWVCINTKGEIVE